MDDYPNNRFTTAVLAVGSPISGEIEIPDDEDWFKVSLTAGTTYVFEIKGEGFGGTLPYSTLRIRNDLNQTQTVASRGNDDFTITSFVPEFSGNYYIAVEGGPDNDTGTYILDSRYATDRDWIGNYASTSHSIPLETTGNWSIGEPGDEDWFRINISEGSEFWIEVSGLDTGGGSLEFPVIYLYDSSGAYITGVSDDANNSRDPSIHRTANESGYYYIAVSATGQSTGTYTLTTTVITPPDDYSDDQSTVGQLSINSELRGEIETTEDEDWIKVEMSQGVIYEFTFIGLEGSEGSLPIQDSVGFDLLDSSGNRVIDYQGYRTPESLSYRYSLETSGTYYLSVDVFQTQPTITGTYLVKAEEIVDDYGSDITTIDWIFPGDSIHGDFEIASDQDWFKIDLSVGNEYLFELYGATGGGGTATRLGLALVDPFGSQITNDIYAGSTGKGAEISYIPEQSGTYYLVSRGIFSDEALGTYTIEATLISGDTDDFPDDQSTDVVLPLGGQIAGEIEVEGDEDWFQVNLTAGKTYLFEEFGDTTGGGSLSGNTYLSLYNPSGSHITTYGIGSIYADTYLPYQVATSGTYYLSVRNVDNEVGSYTLRATEIVDDYGQSPPDAGVIRPGEEIFGNIETKFDKDWFKVELNSENLYRFDLFGAESSRGTLSPLGESYITLFDESGETVLATVKNEYLHDPSLDFTPSAAGTYYLEIGEDQDRGYGTYVFAVSRLSSDDFGHSPTTAGELSIDGSIVGEIETDGDKDWFEVQLTAGTLYVFELGGAESNSGTIQQSELYLYDADGKFVSGVGNTIDNGYDPGFQFLAEVTGTYYLQVQGYHYAPEDRGTFTGTYTVHARHDDFGNQYQGQFGQLDIEGSITGELEADWDTDLFQVELVSGEDYVFALRGEDTGGGTLLKPVLVLMDSDYNYISQVSDAVGNGKDPLISFSPTESGSYFLLSRLGSGTYTLEASTLVDDFGQTRETAGQLTLEEIKAGEIEVPGDRDWFSIELEAGSSYSFELLAAGSGAGTLGQLGPTGIFLLSPELSSVGGSNGGSDTDAYFEYTPEASGTYFLETRGVYSPEFGTYKVLVSELPESLPIIDDFAGDMTTLGVLTIGGQITGEIEIAGDKDWFAVDLTSGVEYKFELTGADGNGGTLGASGEAQLILFDNTGDMLAFTNNGGAGDDPLIVFTSQTTGVYFLSAEGYFETETGTYTLTADIINNTSPEPQPEPENNSPEGDLLLYGNAIVGASLLAESRGISDADGLGTFEYQWFRDEEPIGGATSQEYQLTENDNGHLVGATATYTDGASNEEVVLSETRLVTAATSPSYSNLIEMYVIILGRAPARGGLDFWSGFINQGKDFEYIAGEMWNSDGAREFYPSDMTTEEVVSSVYLNILVREPKEAGLNYWVSQWGDNGPVETMLEMIGALTANNSSDPLAIADKELFQSKVDIGGYLANTVGNVDVDLASAAFDYLEAGYSVEETKTFIDTEMGVIGQAQIQGSEDMFA